jgi:hypothetical protein
MFKPLSPSLAFVATVALSGCNTTSAVNAINSVTGALSSPAASTAANNLKVGATALICDVGDASALTNQIATQIGAGRALIKDSENVYVISSTVCAALGGAVVGQGLVPATAAAN